MSMDCAASDLPREYMRLFEELGRAERALERAQLDTSLFS